MNKEDLQEIGNILKEIKSKSVFVGGGSGEAERASMRDARIVWDLGVKINDSLNNSGVPNERRKEEVRKIARTLDKQFLGKNNDWSNYAYEWFLHFKDLEYYLFVARLAGFRENNEKNRFTKRRVRYLLPIYTKLDEPSLPKQKREKLTALLNDDKSLSLSHDEYLAIITQVRGQHRIQWSEIRSSLDDLSNQVELAMESDELERKKLRDSLGPVLITQIRYALQLCLMDRKSDFDNAYDRAKDTFRIKASSVNTNFQQLFINMKDLIRDFDEKSKRIKKNDYYDLEKLNSNLDAITSEETYNQYMKRKKALGEVFS